MTVARHVAVRGIVQGVGFRPFTLRLAREHGLTGWVLNGEDGVEIFVEGHEDAVEAFQRDIERRPPPAARIAAVRATPAQPAGFGAFTIRKSQRGGRPSVRISPDLPVCDDCLRELFDPGDPRYLYPYITCTNCGPRYTVILELPYDRSNTTLRNWPLDAYCAGQYHDPLDRRFHAQPVACPRCGPGYRLQRAAETTAGSEAGVRRAAELLRHGCVVAVKGLGGYHLACDARDANAVAALRERKFRKEKPFAVMAADLGRARQLVALSPEAEALLTSAARPIVLAAARERLAGIAPDNDEIGVMLPYTPLHAMLFAMGAPDVLVMTSANRSSEPIAYEEADALARLAGIADAFLIGSRPIARRVDDSVARAGALGPIILRRSRGYAPAAVATMPAGRPILGVGADLKNAVTLVVGGQAFVSQHIGDLDHRSAYDACRQTIDDLMAMYDVPWNEVTIAHDLHPEYVSTRLAGSLAGRDILPVQHHRAHVASVLAEREAWDRQVLGLAFDGTGYGDDGTIWGGEMFAGSVAGGFERVGHLRRAVLPGGDAAARWPVQAAAGFLAQVQDLPNLTAPPFAFPDRFANAQALVRASVRTIATTSMGRLFDTVAALAGFTREATYEGQAAMWVEHLARRGQGASAYPCPFDGAELDFRPLLDAVVRDRARGRDVAAIARAFQSGLAEGVAGAAVAVCDRLGLETVVLSGGVFQNEQLAVDVAARLAAAALQVWTNHVVPPNDGGISLGQAAMAAFAPRGVAQTVQPAQSST
jgi:hydrogenase maturation protein HypF